MIVNANCHRAAITASVTALSWRIREPDERRALPLLCVHAQEPHADARGSLHVAGLRDEKVRPDAMFGLDPVRPLVVARRAREQIRRHLFREGEMFGIA